MTVLARTKSGVKRIRRHREGRAGTCHEAQHVSVERLTQPRAPAGCRAGVRLGGLQDEAVYTCECGFVFHAPVSTSVGCPQCGGSQAW